MNFYNELINLTDDEIEQLVRYKIDMLEPTSEETFIGYDIDYNFNKAESKDVNGTTVFDVNIRCFYPGYISKGKKIIFGMFYDREGNVSNNGCYYYMDTDDYIVDFCKYIKQFSIESEAELFEYILDFLRDHYGYIPVNSREEMFRMIVNSKEKNEKPINEHGISWFKGRGNALCTEYSIMAQNILSIFDISSYLVIGSLKIDAKKKELHAYNIISTNNNVLLIDFSNYVKVFDHDFNKLAVSPFIGELDDIELDEDFVDNYILNQKPMIFENYDYYIINNTLVRISLEDKRTYCCDGIINMKQYNEKNISDCKICVKTNNIN